MSASDDNVAMMVDMGIPLEDAAECLKERGNNVEDALEYYFSGRYEEDKQSKATVSAVSTWEQSTWVDTDNVGPTVPIITENEKPIYDLTMDSDDNVERAYNAMQDVRPTTPQQGLGWTTPTTNVHFGPATRNSYPTENWSLVPTTTQADAVHEIFPDPSPKDRKRHGTDPAALKPITGTSLPPFLLLMYSIPLARILLSGPIPALTNYGSPGSADDATGTWWNAQCDELLGSRVCGAEERERDRRDLINFVAEVQRVIAFLGGSERAYGSCEHILRGLERCAPRRTDSGFLGEFFGVWGRARKVLFDMAKDKPGYYDLLPEVFQESIGDGDRNPFESVACMFSNSNSKGDGEGEGGEIEISEKEKFSLLELEIKPGTTSLYTTIDSLIWPSSSDSNIDDKLQQGCFTDLADIFCLRLKSASTHQGTGLRLEKELNPKRWMEDMVPEVRERLKERKELEAERARLEERRGDVDMVEGGYKADALFNEVADYLKKPRVTLPSLEDDEESDVEGTEQPTTPAPELTPDINALMTKQFEKIKAAHEEVMTEGNAVVERINTLLTTLPSNDTDPALEYRYLLRGISPDPSTAYFLAPTPEAGNLISFDEDGMGRRDENEEWWCVTWNPEYATNPFGLAGTNTPIFGPGGNGGSPCTVRKASEEEVLGVAELKDGAGDGMLVVYARDWACENVTVPVLDGALKEFIQRDNELFREELAHATEPASPLILPSAGPGLGGNVNHEVPETPPPLYETTVELKDKDPDDSDDEHLGSMHVEYSQ
ncbi:hypothetical protein YB2330_000361 [Saitoella coloradoensis]